jgi:DNA-binding CsgD family transcriptional regulator
LLAALRIGEHTFFQRGGLPTIDLQPLEDSAAASLLENRFPALAPKVRDRLLHEAQGNPLALLELPVSLTEWQRTTVEALPAVLPLGRRLKSMFASRVNQLRAETRQLLLIAVLDGTGDPGVLRVASGQQRLETLGPAERAQLVRLDETCCRLAFRHPLIRSAVVELSTSDERREVHRRLADVYRDEPERRAWHLAEAAVKPDEEVAALLQEIAHANFRRGDAESAVAQLLRAADLSPTGSLRSIRLAEAAYVGANVNGDLRHVPTLLAAARQADPEHSGSLAGAVAAAYELLSGDGDVETAHRLLLGAIEALPDLRHPNNEMLHEALYSLLMVSFFGGRAELWSPVHAAIDRLDPRPRDDIDILARTFGDPVRSALPALARLDAAIADLANEVSPARIVRTAIAAAYIDRLPGCRGALRRVVERGRDGVAVTSAIEALFLLSNDAFFTGRWVELVQLTDEGLAFCQANGYRLLEWPGLFLRALLAATRGDDDSTLALADEMLRWAEPRRVRSVQYYAAHAKALAALGRGDFESAFQQASSISPAGTFAPYIAHALWVLMDLVDAAVHTGRHAEAAAHVAAARKARIANISPRLSMIVSGAAAMADPDHNHEHFQAALAIPDGTRWPFEHARIQLAYGERLRRIKSTDEARKYLRGALDTFERLDARPWVMRARSELRAAGVSIDIPERVPAACLTPQEREIAMLAATGLTNKQIGERLFLSHRTVATHLYQLFPKLGVTSRAALRDALAHADAARPELQSRRR